MKFSVWPNPARPTSEILDLARMADAEGWFGMWFADHYMPNTGSETIQPGNVHECWAMLPAIAAVTERIRIIRRLDFLQQTGSGARAHG